MIKQYKKQHLVAEGAKLNNRQLKIIEEEVVLGTGEKGWVFYVEGYEEGGGEFISQEHLDSGVLTKKDAYDRVSARFEFLADPV